MSAAASMQQPGSHPGSASGTPGPVGTPQPLQQPMSNPSMLMQQQQQQQQVQQQVQQQQQQQMQQQQQQQQLPRPPPLDPAKEKLITCIHEYLLANGAPKAAETLKIEMGPSFPNAKWVTSGNDSTGFLQSWWSLFFDLYCAAPERRTDPELMPNPSQEAKYFHDYNMAQSNFPMMNGMPPQFAGPGGMMGPEGMMPGFPGRGFPGGPRGGGPPVGHPMAPSPFMGYDPRMGGGRPPGMGGAGPGGRPPQQMTPGSFPVAAMRPPPPHMQGQQMPPQGMYRGPFMDSQAPPGSFPTPHGMGMNGGGGVMGMGSPGMQPMQHPGGGPPGYMMMPTSSAPMPPFGAMAPGVSSEGMTGPPSHPSQSAHTPLGNGPASAGIPGTSAGAPLSAGNAGMGGGMMNGEMKNSPHTPRGNGGTPGAHGGPGSGAPGSVHSGGAGSVPPPGGDGITPKQEPMDTNHMEGDAADKSEVEKIKASLISDFNTKDEISSDQYGY